MAINNFYKNKQRGMTLIELIVVVGIVALVSSVLVFNYSGFRTGATLRGLSQEVALAVRKAQSYATSVQSISAGSTRDYPAYGISFSKSAPGDDRTPSSKRFIMFADIGGDSRNNNYDKGSTCSVPVAGNECLESFGINSADSITEVCAKSTSISECGASQVDITFERPAPDARICIGTDCAFSRAEVTVGSDGRSRVITVWNTGQISVSTSQ